MSGEDSDSTGNAEQRLTQGDCESSPDQSPELALVLEYLRPENDDCCHGEYSDYRVGETIKAVMFFGRNVAGFDDFARQQSGNRGTDDYADSSEYRNCVRKMRHH